jgi:hypothetical protein
VEEAAAAGVPTAQLSRSQQQSQHGCSHVLYARLAGWLGRGSLRPRCVWGSLSKLCNPSLPLAKVPVARRPACRDATPALLQCTDLKCTDLSNAPPCRCTCNMVPDRDSHACTDARHIAAGGSSSLCLKSA